jgi:hypothetical protein
MSSEYFFTKATCKSRSKILINDVTETTAGENAANQHKLEQLARTMWRGIVAAAKTRKNELNVYSTLYSQCLDGIMEEIRKELGSMFHNNNRVLNVFGTKIIIFHTSMDTVEEMARTGEDRFSSATNRAIDLFIQENNIRIAKKAAKHKEQTQIDNAHQVMSGHMQSLKNADTNITQLISAIDTEISKLRQRMDSMGIANGPIRDDLHQAAISLSYLSQQTSNIQQQLYALTQVPGIPNEAYLKQLITQDNVIYQQLNELNAKVSGIGYGLRYAPQAVQQGLPQVSQISQPSSPPPQHSSPQLHPTSFGPGSYSAGQIPGGFFAPAPTSSVPQVFKNPGSGSLYTPPFFGQQ